MNRPIHFEILTEHPQQMPEFYQAVLGWQISSAGMTDPYWLATTGTPENPGINGAIRGRHFPQTVINTIEVDSLAETIRKVEAAGGRKVHGPGEIPGVGLHAYCADPDGVLFGILQPAANQGPSTLRLAVDHPLFM